MSKIIKNYKMTVYRTGEGGENEWAVEFPEFKGVVGGGSTCEEAVAEAKENLSIMIEHCKNLKEETKR